MIQFFLDDDIHEICEHLSAKSLDQKLDGKTVLLTGGRGFLGRYFTQVFVNLNANYVSSPIKLIVLDNLITAGKQGSEIPDLPNTQFIQHDITKPFEYNEPIDYIIHAAGIASPFYYRAYPLETLHVAISGTQNALELAKQHNARLTFFSSSEIYGDPDPKRVPTQESYRGNVACQGPRACYDESKRVGETLCYIFHNMYGVSTNIIRPFNVFGPGMQETDYRVLPNFASRIKSQKPLNVYGTGNQTRTFCYITDAIVGFLSVIINGISGETYNIGCESPEISMLELVEKIQSVIDKDVVYNVIEHPDSYPADEPNRRCPDITKAKLQLGYEPSVSLETGLQRFFSWTSDAYKAV